jgi:hypothetical protein
MNIFIMNIGQILLIILSSGAFPEELPLPDEPCGKRPIPKQYLL